MPFGIPRGTTFSSSQLEPRSVPVLSGEENALSSFVLYNSIPLNTDLVATANISPGFLVVGSYEAAGFSEDLSLSPEALFVSDDLIETSLSISGSPVREEGTYADPAEVLHLITDELPPRHIACVRVFGGTVLLSPEDYRPVSLWSAAGRMQSIRHTADTCPIGGHPRTCGILTSGADPIGDIQRAEGRAPERYLFVTPEDREAARRSPAGEDVLLFLTAEANDVDLDEAGEEEGAESVEPDRSIRLIDIPSCVVADEAGLSEEAAPLGSLEELSVPEAAALEDPAEIVVPSEPLPEEEPSLEGV